MRLVFVFALASVILASLATSAQAACNASERPRETPRAINVDVLSDTQLQLRWLYDGAATFDLFVRDPRGGVVRNMAGIDLPGRAYIFRNLPPSTSFQFAVRARSSAGREGCVGSTSNWVVASTPSKANLNICTNYAANATKQFCQARYNYCGGSPPRWSADTPGHFKACLDWRAKGQTFDIDETAARQSELNACIARGHPGVGGGITPYPCPH